MENMCIIHSINTYTSAITGGFLANIISFYLGLDLGNVRDKSQPAKLNRSMVVEVEDAMRRRSSTFDDTVTPPN